MMSKQSSLKRSNDRKQTEKMIRDLRYLPQVSFAEFIRDDVKAKAREVAAALESALRQEQVQFENSRGGRWPNGRIRPPSMEPLPNMEIHE